MGNRSLNQISRGGGKDCIEKLPLPAVRQSSCTSRPNGAAVIRPAGFRSLNLTRHGPTTARGHPSAPQNRADIPNQMPESPHAPSQNHSLNPHQQPPAPQQSPQTHTITTPETTTPSSCTQSSCCSRPNSAQHYSLGEVSQLESHQRRTTTTTQQLPHKSALRIKHLASNPAPILRDQPGDEAGGIVRQSPTAERKPVS